jgi:ACS family glucarate transporter-like MFS transporter
LNRHPGYRWYILILAALTGAFAVGAPAMCLAVLFGEITADLDLNLVQMGLLWSIGSLPAIFTSPLCGALDDRFGPKRVILSGTFLIAVAAGLRGLANSFIEMFLIIILIGILLPLVTMSAFKICGIWFSQQQLGLANGILSMGLALGFLVGSLLSETVLSPWLGGWRNVIFFYAGVALLFCIPWMFARAAPEDSILNQSENSTVTMRQALGHVVKMKNLWLLGITVMGASGCMQGLSGYLPTYLRGLGWAGASADGALSLLSATSLVFILPITLWSDRLGARKKIVLSMVLIIAVGTGLLSVANGLLVWGVLALMGAVRDSSTALLITMSIETDGVGPTYAGSASGLVMLFLYIGNLISPPLGNKLADISPGLPFVFWAGLAVIGIVSISLVRKPQPVTGIRNDEEIALG